MGRIRKLLTKRRLISVIYLVIALPISYLVAGASADEVVERGSIVDIIKTENMEFPLAYPGENAYTTSSVDVSTNDRFDLQIKGSDYVGINKKRIIGIDNLYVSLDNKTWKRMDNEYITLKEDHDPGNHTIIIYHKFKVPPVPADNYKSKYFVRTKTSPWEWVKNPTFFIVFATLFVFFVQLFNFVKNNIIR